MDQTPQGRLCPFKEAITPVAIPTGPVPPNTTNIASLLIVVAYISRYQPSFKSAPMNHLSDLRQAFASRTTAPITAISFLLLHNMLEF